MAADEKEQRLLALLAEGPCAAAELSRRLGISQPTFSRLAAGLAGDLVRLGRARATLYARLRPIREMGSSFPVYRIDATGDAHRFGVLTSIRARQFWWEPVSGQARLYRQLPWFLQEMRPDGFMGRAFARRLQPEFGLPARLQDWNDDDVLTALARRGEDCMGNLVVGEESLARYLRGARDAAAPVAAADYPRLAGEALAGAPAGSSAGGEQPKFAALLAADGALRQVLVKFSPPVTTPEGERWSDLLVCEHLALEIIAAAGLSAPASLLYSAGERIFLQVDRFDRSGRFGRGPLYSIGVVDDEFFGRRDSWIAMADRLATAGMLAKAEASCLRLLSLFGTLIANTDQHFGNASLIPVDDWPAKFRLAPAYDMLPMLYRPLNGETPRPDFVPPPPAPLHEWNVAHGLALAFWERAGGDERISAQFRAICAGNRALLQQFANGPRLVA